MPRNNPYDKELSPRRQAFSNISLGITILLVIAFILWVIFSQPKNIRTKLDNFQIPIQFSDNAEEQNEFSELLDALSSPQGFSPNFISDFPNVTALLKMQSPVYQENVPCLLVFGNCAAVAEAYHNTANQDVVSMDVLLLPYQSVETGIHFDSPVRYSVSYDTVTGVIEKTDLRTDAYRLNFYNFTVSFQTQADSQYQIQLSSVISDKEAETGNLLSAIQVSPDGAKPNLIRGENNSVVEGKIPGVAQPDSSSLTIGFNDLYYDYFDGLTLETQGDMGTITVTLH